MKKMILTAMAAVLPMLSVMPAFANAPARSTEKPAPVVKAEKKACKTAKKNCMRTKTQKVSLHKKAGKIVASKPAKAFKSTKVSHKA